MTMIDDYAIRLVFEDLALAAGRRIMEIKACGFEAKHKADQSPVTIADHEAEAIILAGLREKLPDILVIAEEEAAAGRCPARHADEFILVDPLDGTKEFVSGRGDFTVNIALIRKGVPVVGVVYAPVSQKLYAGDTGSAVICTTNERHDRLTEEPIQARAPLDPLVIVASRSHCTPETEDIIARHPGAEIVSVGSSVKFCLIAAGEADLYPRLSPTMQWDTAAGDAVLRNAQGVTLECDGSLLAYGPRDGDLPWRNPWFIAEGQRS